MGDLGLTGLVFHIDGLFSVNKKKNLTQIIEDNGGTVLYMFSSKVTHLLTTLDEKSKNNSKVKRAIEKGVKVVDETFVNSLVAEWTKNNSNKSMKKNTSFSKSKEELNVMTSNHHNTNDTEQEFDNSLIMLNSIKPMPQLPPTLTTLLPNHGPCTGDFQVAIIGLNMIPSSQFRVRFGDVDAINYEFHSLTSIVCSLPHCKSEAGEVSVSASNDGGINFGFPTHFKFYG